jgi:DNA invertase Pin-like site-specific DNA recombinase
MRVIVAARLSQLADGQTGLDSQDEDAREWAEDNGHEVITVAADHKSGTVAPWDRPALKPWVTRPDLLASYDGIVAAKQDRLSRAKWRDETDIRRWAEDNGKVLFIVDKNMMWPPADEDDVSRWNDGADQARREWVSTSKRYRRMQKRLRDSGAVVGRPAWGYQVEGDRKAKRFVPTDEGRRLVPEVYRRIAAGQTLAAVAGWLADETGRPWWPRTVSGLIRHTVYRGSHQDATGREIHRCEALVTGQEWQAAAGSLAARPKRGTHLAEVSALSSVLRCMRCGGPMYRLTCGSGNQVKVAYYRCAGSGPLRRGCGNMVKCSGADLLVDEVMSRLDRPVVEWRRVKGHNHDAEIQDVVTALRDLVNQGLDEDAEDAERAHLRAERKRLESLPAVADTWVPVATGETYAQQWSALAPAARRAWLKAYAPRLECGREGMLLEKFAATSGDFGPIANDEAFTVHTGHGLSLTIVWRVAEDEIAA